MQAGSLRGFSSPAIPPRLLINLRLLAVVAPMFLVSNPALVIAACRAGVIGTFTSLNRRTLKGYQEWLDTIEAALGRTKRAMAST